MHGKISRWLMLNTGMHAPPQTMNVEDAEDQEADTDGNPNPHTKQPK